MINYMLEYVFIENQISDDIFENRKLLYKLLIYIEEMNSIYNKINVFEDNKLTQTMISIIQVFNFLIISHLSIVSTSE